MANSGAVQDPLYQPAMRQISNITQAEQATVTTTFDHQYIVGEIVRLVVPIDYGMQQVNGQTGTIISVTDDTFVIDINTSLYDAFVNSLTSLQYPQVIPIGEVSETLLAATHNTLRPPSNFIS